MMNFWHRLCYRTEHDPNARFDPEKGVLHLGDIPPGTTVHIEYTYSPGFEPLKATKILRTTPRGWFRFVKALLR